MVRRAGIEPACLSAPVFETGSYTCSGTCAYGTRRETRTPMPLRAPVPETGVSTDSTSRAYWYAERESNSQARSGRRPLRPMCLPFHHLRILAATAGFEPAHGSSPSTGFPNRPLQPLGYVTVWRFQSDLNRRSRICRPLPFQLGYGTECMAAAVGLEPTHGFPPHGFQDRSLTI